MTSGESQLSHGSYKQKYATLHRIKESIFIDSGECKEVRKGADLDDHQDCRNKLVCVGAPQGYLTWTSGHHSDLAIVNSPVVLTIIDVPGHFVSTPSTFYRAGRPVNPPYTRDPFMSSSSSSYLAFANDEHGDPLIRIWPAMEPGSSYGQVTDYLDWLSPGTCIADELPLFNVILEELRPDIPDQARVILDLFGSQSLDWWNSLTTEEQRRNSEARGLDFWGDLTTKAARDQELEERSSALTQEIACNAGATAWCRWLPTRSGYFKATAAGAWIIKQNGGAREWRRHRPRQRSTYLDNLDVFLSDSSNTPWVRQVLNDENLQAAEAGLGPSLTAHLTPPAGTFTDEWLYTAEAGAQYRCPNTDFRVSCGGSSRAGNYTETEPVGIRVHEMRVATRIPEQLGLMRFDRRPIQVEALAAASQMSTRLRLSAIHSAACVATSASVFSPAS